MQFVGEIYVDACYPRAPVVLLRCSILELRFASTASLYHFCEGALYHCHAGQVCFVGEQVSFYYDCDRVNVSVLRVQDVTGTKSRVNEERADCVDRFSNFSFVCHWLVDYRADFDRKAVVRRRRRVVSHGVPAAGREFASNLHFSAVVVVEVGLFHSDLCACCSNVRNDLLPFVDRYFNVAEEGCVGVAVVYHPGHLVVL